MNDFKRIYYLCGNARTFFDCFDSTYENIIDKLFCDNTKQNTHVLLYLKCDDPGPKGQGGWNFTYQLIDETILKKYISKLTKKYNNISFHSEILPTNKINDSQLLSQVKKRNLYTGFLGQDNKLLRALHCHYNIEDCGKIINQIESDNKFNFDFYIYIRPDLFFHTPCHNISQYVTNTDKIILGKGPNSYNNDHIAIIPHKYKDNFFFERMNLIRTNDKEKLTTSEEIYWNTIQGKYIVKQIGKYLIKRTLNDTSAILISSDSVSSELTNVKEIYSNMESFAALKNDGSVVTWGSFVPKDTKTNIYTEYISRRKIFFTFFIILIIVSIFFYKKIARNIVSIHI